MRLWSTTNASDFSTTDPIWRLSFYSSDSSSSGPKIQAAIQGRANQATLNSAQIDFLTGTSNNADLQRVFGTVGNAIKALSIYATDGIYFNAGVDNNVGIKRDTDSFVVKTANTERMRIDSSGNVGIGTSSPSVSLDINSTDAFRMPSGTSAQRPSSPTAGMIRYNTDFDTIEWYDANENIWVQGTGVLATGGTVTEIVDNGITYRVHSFTSVGTSSFQVLRGGAVEYLVVAGGGGGGGTSNINDGGGGGGAGEFTTGTITIEAGSFTINVGDGGSGGPPGNTASGKADRGEDSSAFSITCIGGGGGLGPNYGFPNGQASANGGYGGGGGGGGAGGSGGLAIGNFQGNDGADAPDFRPAGSLTGGGGGGAGEAAEPASSYNGQRGGNGGDGLESSINGTSTFYAGGGGGGGGTGGNPGVVDGGNGGLGGGADGGNINNPGINATANTGGGAGGGGGTGGSGVTGGDGGSGIVIIRYRIG
jgi:hypothetical protein